ncbi:MAG: RnfABCDGE type electron transport complex subunit D [Planctomycetota bacterium]
MDPDQQSLASRRRTATVSLLPAIMVGIFVFGWWAGWIVLLSVLTAFLTNTVCHRFIYKDSFGARDGTWLLTGLLLGLMLPPNSPWWLPVIGAMLALFLGKYYLSVDGMSLFQPAALGLLLLYLVGMFAAGFSSGNPMLPSKDGKPMWPILSRSVEPSSGSVRALLRDFFGGDVRRSVTRQERNDAVFAGNLSYYNAEKHIVAEAVHGPRPLDLVKASPERSLSRVASNSQNGSQSQSYDAVDMILGYMPATIGGSSAFALGWGILLLIFTGAISWVLPTTALGAMVAALYALSWLYDGRPDAQVIAANIPIQVLTGSTLLGIFYLAADPTTAPRSFLGKVYAGVALGLIEVLLRVFTPLTEGIFLSVILVQGSAIIIDQWLAPPTEKPRSSPHGLSSSSLSRL